MASRDKTDLLKAFLGSLPSGLAGRVAQAVEVDRMNNGKVLPHELILDSLRPALREADQARRTNTPMRVFARPFEDLLTNHVRARKQKGRIARSSINPVWNWLARDVVPEQSMAFALAVKTAALGLGDEDVDQQVADFWRLTAEALRNKLGSEGGRRQARQALGGDEVMEDAREMGLLLYAAADFCTLQDQLPNRIPALTDDVIHAFRESYESLLKRLPEAAPYLPLVVMKRLEFPWEALRLPLGATQSPDESADHGDDLGLVGEILFGALEAHVAALLEAAPEHFNADVLVGHLHGFTTLCKGVVKEVEMRRDGLWSERLMKDCAAVAEAMDRFMEDAPSQILSALPMQVDQSDVPEMFNAPDLEKCDRALCYARLLAGSRSLASAGSFAASLLRADQEIAAALRRYNEAIVRELRYADDDQRQNAEQYAAIATELTTILFSLDESEALRQRRGAAAAQTLAA
ncbi:MAG: hypothetical protein JO056_09300 [Alphaproteobacteria bacterium]|nr:hypothetical protein [Alphaproteobacteria bacterium]